MAVYGRAPKRARVTAGLLDLLAFPEGARPEDGPFRGNVRGFLARFARPVPGPGQAVPGAGVCWQVGFRVGEEGEVVVMEVVEEDVSTARRIYCEHCTVAGWSRHPVCRKRYHFIIQNENDIPHCKTCRHCGLMVELFEARCPSCNHELSLDDPEDWNYARLENPRHLLHGIVHTNGFGHLVRIHGHEGGSKLLSGSQLMDFWDRFCKYLRVRKVSVIDVSKKYGLDWRILHAIATGHSWYGRWGFRFGCGSFGITFQAYQKAIHSLSSVPLSLFFPHSRCPRSQLQNTISFYQSLSNHPLATLHDLFLFVMELLASKNVPMHKKELVCDVQMQSRKWANDEIQRAMGIILKVLRAADITRWVPFRTLKAAVTLPIGSSELVDNCLKALHGTRTDDGMIVAVRCNSEMCSVEYRLVALQSDQLILMQTGYRPTRDHLLHDIKFLYDALLYPHTVHAYKPASKYEHTKRSAIILLDCKQFIKHYDLEEDFLPPNLFALHTWCNVELSDQVDDPPCTPPEILTLPLRATVADLKLEAMRAFHEIYLMFQNFVADQLLDCATASDTTQIKLLFGENGTVRIQGRCTGGERRVGIYRMERGIDKWTVNCSCGAMDDDGERMLSCDSCSVWQHTRCAGINDFGKVPKRFVCKSCKLLHKIKLRPVHSSSPNKRCKISGTSAFGCA